MIVNRYLKPALTLTLLAALVTPALAVWPNKSTVNLPVCTATDNQQSPTIVSDGTGGAIITWQDARSGNADVYAQHVLASGTKDPAWPVDGRALCTAANSQLTPLSVSDDNGGAIVTWQDLRNGNTDIYAQHVLASGNTDPAWPVNGRALCTAAGNQFSLKIVSDGAGGAIVTWSDLRGATQDIYAQHLLASGTADPAWPLDGRALCTALSTQDAPDIASDGAGGAIATWIDARGGNWDIYAQHVLASGAVDAAWPANGRALCTTLDTQYLPTIVSDGAGGAIVTWRDSRNGLGDIFAQHVLAYGAVDPSWPLDGRALCTATGSQDAPTIVSDGGGGAIVTWSDYRSSTNEDLYVQHVLATGAVDPSWPLDGCALCTAANDQGFQKMVSDGAGGAIVTWRDTRVDGVRPDVFVQHVLPTGTVDPAWPVNGRALCNAANAQESPTIVSDGAGGAIVVWQDFRTGVNTDIYAQRVARFGYIGTPGAEIAGVKDVPNDNGGKVKVSWTASYLDLAQDANLAAYDVYRSVPPNTVASARATGAVRVIREGDMLPLNRSGLVAFPAASNVYSWEFVATVNPNHFASLYSVVTATAFDSLGAGNPKTAFLVLARNASGSMFWPSPPDSGYSVDNVPPVTPAPFTANYATGTAYLHWNPNVEADLAGYRLYRGTSVAFTPSPATLVAALPDTGYADAVGSPYVYKLTAIDIHGNESPVATIVPSGTTGVGDRGQMALSFAAPSPNPARGATTLRYTLSRAGHVRLSVYDAAGRRVATLHDGEQEAGAHAASFALRDAAGRELASGLYLVQLEAEGRVLTRRLATIR